MLRKKFCYPVKKKMFWSQQPSSHIIMPKLILTYPIKSKVMQTALDVEWNGIGNFWSNFFAISPSWMLSFYIRLLARKNCQLQSFVKNNATDCCTAEVQHQMMGITRMQDKDNVMQLKSFYSVKKITSWYTIVKQGGVVTCVTQRFLVKKVAKLGWNCLSFISDVPIVLRSSWNLSFPEKVRIDPPQQTPEDWIVATRKILPQIRKLHKPKAHAFQTLRIYPHLRQNPFHNPSQRN